jgi:hypothetical protein
MTSADPGQLVVVRRFWTLQEALAAKGVLDTSGIESFIADEHVISMTTSNLGGVRLFVKQSDAETAGSCVRRKLSSVLLRARDFLPVSEKATFRDLGPYQPQIRRGYHRIGGATELSFQSRSAMAANYFSGRGIEKQESVVVPLITAPIVVVIEIKQVHD